MSPTGKLAASLLLLVLAELAGSAAARPGRPADGGASIPLHLPLPIHMMSNLTTHIAAAQRVASLAALRAHKDWGWAGGAVPAGNATTRRELAAARRELASIPAPSKQPAQKWTAASIAASFTKIPASLLDPLIPYNQQYPGLSGCAASLLTFGGSDNPGFDNAPALTAASASGAPTLFLPNSNKKPWLGTAFRVSTSVTLTKPLVVACGASLSVDAGVTLTITAQPRLACRSGNKPIFGGAGQVRFSGPSFEVFGGWFAQYPGTTGPQRAADSCTGPCTLMITSYHGLNQTLFLNPNNGLFTTFHGNFATKTALPLQYISLRPGSYKRQISLKSFGNFVGTAVVVQGGVSNANILIGQANAAHWTDGAQGLTFRPGGGVISGVTVNIAVCQLVRYCVVVDGTGTLKNVVADLNFGLQTTTLQFRGNGATTLSNFVMRVQVLEAGGAASPDASGVRNDSPGTIRGLVYELSPWSGGFVLPGQTATSIPGQLIQGAFAKLTATISVASDTNPGLLKLAGSPSSTIPIGPKGVSSGSIHSAGAFLNPTGSVAAALSGCCQWTQDSGAAIPGVSLNTAPVYDQAFFLRVPVSPPWPPGQQRTFYFRSWWAATAPASAFASVPFRAPTLGLTVTAFTNVHQSSKGRFPYVVGVTLTNKGKSTVSAIPGANCHRFGVQIGP